MKKPKWTLNNVPDLSGKVIIVTGANTGLGFEAVKALSSKNAEVVLASRDLVKGQEAFVKIKSENPKAHVKLMQLDLADFASIAKFAINFNANYQRLDVLINNAGVMMTPFVLTKNGFEQQMGINFLGHFILTQLLMDVLKVTKGARVVNVSSNAHKYGKLNFEQLMFTDKKGYNPLRAYANSKLANLLFTLELNNYFKSTNFDCIALSAHPGTANTNLSRYLKQNILFMTGIPLFKIFGQSAAMGALALVRAAVDPNVSGGDYFGPSGFGHHRGYPIKVEATSKALNVDTAKKLWNFAEDIFKKNFPE